VDTDEEALEKLTRDEVVLLAAGLRLMMMADGELSPEENEFVTRLGTRLGYSAHGWDLVWTDATRTYPSGDRVRDALSAVEQPRTREALYFYLYQLAEEDSIVDAEWDLLEWLDETWYNRPSRLPR
jgi:hypothetical protein